MTTSGLSAGLAEIERLLSWRQARTMGVVLAISILFCGWVAMLMGPFAPHLVAYGFMFWGMQRAGSAIGREALGKTWDYQCLGAANPLAWLLSRYVAETLPSWLGTSVALTASSLALSGNSSFDFVQYIAATVMPMMAAHAIAFSLGALACLPPVAGRFLRWGVTALAVVAWYRLAIVTITDSTIPMLIGSQTLIELHPWWGLFPLSTSAYMTLWSLSISVCAFAYGAWIVGAVFGRPENIPCGIVFAILAIPLFVAGWAFAPPAFHEAPYLVGLHGLSDAESLKAFSPVMSAWFVLAYLVFAFGRGRIGPQIVISAGFAVLFTWLVLSAGTKDQDILLFAFFAAYTLRDALIVWLFRVARKPVWAAFLICALLRWPIEGILSSVWPDALILLFPHDVPDAGWTGLLALLLSVVGLIIAVFWVRRFERTATMDQQ